MKNKILSISLVIFVVMVVVAVALFVFGGKTEKNDSDAVTVSVTVVNGDQSQEHTLNTKCSNLADALIEDGLAKGENSEYGLYIKEVAGIEADSEKEQWWCITKDGESVMTGASQIKIADGDKYELTLKEGY